jgi:hypothetical protein
VPYAHSLYSKGLPPPRHLLSSFFPLLFLAAVFPAAAQSGPDDAEFFAGASAETAIYSIDSMAAGGGLTAGYGFDIGAIGIGLRYLVDMEGLTTFAPHLFVRFYLPLAFINAEDRFHSGPFLQLDLGPSFHAWNPRIPPDDMAAAVSAGLSAGWRFLLGKHWYAEPAFRAGYPFITGAGVTGGFRF